MSWPLGPPDVGSPLGSPDPLPLSEVERERDERHQDQPGRDHRRKPQPGPAGDLALPSRLGLGSHARSAAGGPGPVLAAGFPGVPGTPIAPIAPSAVPWASSPFAAGRGRRTGSGA